MCTLSEETHRDLPNADAVEERVVDSGGHGKAVGAEEGEVIIVPAVKRIVKILQDIQHIDREPAQSEASREHF